MFNFFRSKKKKEPQPAPKSDDNYDVIIVESVKKITNDAVLLYYKLPELFSFKAGQFITLIFEIDGISYRRAYSFCTDPEDKTAGIGVKCVYNGVISRHIFDNVKENDRIKVMKPTGKFILDEEYDTYLFTAGGSGITPILSMLSVLCKRHTNKNIILVYANNNQESIMFFDELNEMAKNNPNLKVIYVLKEAEKEDKKSIYKGLLSDELLKQIYINLEYSDIRMKNESDSIGCYICGPKPMLDIVKSFYEEVGIQNVFFENFYSVDSKNEKDDDAMSKPSDGSVYKVSIQVNGSEVEIDVPDNKTILGVALDNNIDLPFSCQEGVCEACKGKCISGQVEMDDHDGLSAEDESDGYILTCVSRPKSNDIKITYDD